MVSPISYGRLVEDACRAAAAAAAQQPARVADGAAEDAIALVELLALAGRHADFLGHAAGPRNPATKLAAHVLETVSVARCLLPTRAPSRPNRWHTAADRLAIAHDLLAAQVGPAGEWRGPDAVALQHPGMVGAAAGRLANLVVVVVDSAAPSAKQLRDTVLDPATFSHPGARDELSSLNDAGAATALAAGRALDRVQQVREPAAKLANSLYRPGEPTTLDEVTPLLGDDASSPFDLAVDGMRYAANTLNWPEVRPARAALRAVAELAVTISSWTEELTGWAQRNSHEAAQRAYTRAANQARSATLTWQNVADLLGPLRTLGFDGRQIDEQATRLRRQIDTKIRTGVTPAHRMAALPAARSAVLLLPELANASTLATHRLAREKLLRVPAAGSVWVESPSRMDELSDAYRHAALASRRLADTCTALPGPHPTPGRARFPPDPERPATPPAEARVRPVLKHRDQIIMLQDPRHGQLICDSDRLERALRLSDHNLWDILRPHATRIHLTGAESRATLAALAATYAPEYFNPPQKPDQQINTDAPDEASSLTPGIESPTPDDGFYL